MDTNHNESERKRKKKVERPDVERRLGLPPGVMTIEEAAEYLRIGRQAAYEAAKRDEIPTVKMGRRKLVPIAKLLKLLE